MMRVALFYPPDSVWSVCKQPMYSKSLMRVYACTNKIKYRNIYMQPDIIIIYPVKMYVPVVTRLK